MLYEVDGKVPEAAPDAWVAPGASVIGAVRLAAGVSIWFGAVVRGDVEQISIGRGSNIQDNSILHADPGAPLIIGEGVTVGHGVVLHGCTIGDGSLIGISSTILNRARIGAHCIVGANALVTEGKEFPDGVLIIGSPARVARPLTAAELAALPESASRYVKRAALYRSTLRPVS